MESLVLAAMITLAVSHRILNHMRNMATEKGAWFASLRWADVFCGAAIILMVDML